MLLYRCLVSVYLPHAPEGAACTCGPGRRYIVRELYCGAGKGAGINKRLAGEMCRAWSIRLSKENVPAYVTMISQLRPHSLPVARDAVQDAPHKRAAKTMPFRCPQAHQRFVGSLCLILLPAHRPREFTSHNTAASGTKCKRSAVLPRDKSTSSPCVAPIRGYSSQVQSTESSSSDNKYALSELY